MFFPNKNGTVLSCSTVFFPCLQYGQEIFPNQETQIDLNLFGGCEHYIVRTGISLITGLAIFKSTLSIPAAEKIMAGSQNSPVTALFQRAGCVP